MLKEMLNISKFLLLNQSKTLPKNRRFKSTFFNVNWNSMVVKMKPKYKLRQGFQKELGRRFRRGLFMAYLEERERIMGDALSKRFDWIREFARYNAGDYPLYFLVPKFPAVFFSDVDLLKPELRFTRHSIRQEKKFKAHIIPIMGHNFVVPVAKNFDEKYRLKFLKHLQKTDYPLGEVIRKVNYAEDIDYVFSHLHRH